MLHSTSPEHLILSYIHSTCTSFRINIVCNHVGCKPLHERRAETWANGCAIRDAFEGASLIHWSRKTTDDFRRCAMPKTGRRHFDSPAVAPSNVIWSACQQRLAAKVCITISQGISFRLSSVLVQDTQNQRILSQLYELSS